MKPWKAILEQMAPTIASALGGPLAGSAVKKLAEVVLGKPDAGEQEIGDEILKADPAVYERLKNAEIEYSKFVADHNLQLEKLALDDRASARDREKTVRDWMPLALGLGTTIAFMGLLVLLVFRVIPKENETVFNILLGSLGSAWVSVISYYFGSSAGSDKKTEIMGRAAGS